MACEQYFWCDEDNTINYEYCYDHQTKNGLADNKLPQI